MPYQAFKHLASLGAGAVIMAVIVLCGYAPQAQAQYENVFEGTTTIITPTSTSPPSPWKMDYLNVAGELIIKDGGEVSGNGGGIAVNASSVGSVTVDGNNSIWKINGELRVSQNGNGKLTISDGGTVTSITGSIGFNSGSSGEVTVTGTDSTWENANRLVIGYRDGSEGKLTISDGGTVTNSIGYIGFYEGSSGEVTVTGTGSTWTNDGTLYVGSNGSGKLTINEGGTVTSTSGIISAYGYSSGEVTVTGAGSTWTNNGALVVGGSNGTGKLTISDGGTVTSLNAYVSGSEYPASSGEVTVEGAG